jgi:Domain of unknown function (DUF1902)
MAMDNLIITAMWDAVAQVWVAESEQIGIATEAPSLDALVAKLPTMIQDLRERPDFVPFEVVVRVDVGMQRVPSSGPVLRQRRSMS